MPAMSNEWWEKRLQMDAPCHYLDPVTDWYAWQVRTAGIRRRWPAPLQGPECQILDVGCGDGRYSEWMTQTFGVTVHGTDAFEYKDVRQRLATFTLADGEALASVFAGKRFDMATCLTSLCCMRDWQACIEQVGRLTERILVVENTQTPIPPWQQGLHQKHHIQFQELVFGMYECGFDMYSAIPVNVIDRAWMLRMPAALRWPVAWASQALDKHAYRWFDSEEARYTAILFERWIYDEDGGGE